MKISFISPHRRYPGPERKAYRLCGKQLYVYHGSLECSHLATKEPGNDLGFIKNHESAPVSTDLLPTNARMIILASILGTLLFIIGYFLIIEILDHTLRDKIRAERITGGTVIGAYPRESKLRYRRYNKAINKMAVRQLSTALLPHLNTQEQRVINLLSTEEKDGKTHVARLIEEYWSSIGLNVRRITYDEDFLSEDSQYVQANNLKELCSDLEKG